MQPAIQQSPNHRLFVTDIDGTIYGPKHPISQETKVAVALLRRRGIEVTLATGRNQWEAQAIVTELGLSLPVILANGAQIFSFSEGHLLYAKPFCLATLMDFLRKIPADFPLLIRWYAKDSWQECALPDFGEQVGLQEVKRVILLDPSQTLELFDADESPYWIFRDGQGQIELTPKDANKGEGLLELCSLLKIGPGQVVALGNDTNDLELIQTAGLGLAVQGGHPQLLEVCQGITGRMEDHPVRDIAEWMVGNTPWERIVMWK